jgi:hypothetical protein
MCGPPSQRFGAEQVRVFVGQLKGVGSAKSGYGWPSQMCSVGQVRDVVGQVRRVVGKVRGLVGQVRGVEFAKSEV